MSSLFWGSDITLLGFMKFAKAVVRTSENTVFGNIAFFMNRLCCAQSLSRVWLFVTPWMVACRLLCPWASPGNNTGVGCHALLQGIFPTQGLNPGLPMLQADSLASDPTGMPVKRLAQPLRGRQEEKGGLSCSEHRRIVLVKSDRLILNCLLMDINVCF